MTYTAFILMGLPGAGKTTYAKTHHAGAVHCSADHYFETPEGYKYDAAKASLAHGVCMRNFIRACEMATNDVLVDNTNVNVHSIAGYVAVAHAFGYTPRIIFVRAPADAQQRQTHNVPEMVWMGMRNQLNELLAKWPGLWPKLETVNGY